MYTYIDIYIHIYIYIYTHIHIYIYIYIHTYLELHALRQAHSAECSRVRRHSHAWHAKLCCCRRPSKKAAPACAHDSGVLHCNTILHIHGYISVYPYIYMYIYMYIYVYIYIYMCIYIYIHVCIYIPVRQGICHAIDFVIRIDIGSDVARGGSSKRRVRHYFNGGGLGEAMHLGIYNLVHQHVLCKPVARVCRPTRAAKFIFIFHRCVRGNSAKCF